MNWDGDGKNSSMEGESGIRWKFIIKLDDLDFTDNVALLSSSKEQIQEKNLVRLQDQEAT